MKKLLLVGFLLLGSLALIGCDRNIEQEYESADAEELARQICLERNGQLSIDDKRNELCIFDDYDFCYINDVLCFGLTESSPYTITHKKNPDGCGWGGVSVGLIRDSEGNFESYRREGEWIYDCTGGRVILKGTYSGGKMDGEWFLYEGDSIQANEIYEDGKIKQVISCDICGGDIDEDGTIWKLIDSTY